MEKPKHWTDFLFIEWIASGAAYGHNTEQMCEFWVSGCWDYLVTQTSLVDWMNRSCPKE